MSCGSWSIDTNAENNKSKSPEKQQEATTYGEEVYDVSTVSQIRANSSSPDNLQFEVFDRTTAPFVAQGPLNKVKQVLTADTKIERKVRIECLKNVRKLQPMGGHCLRRFADPPSDTRKETKYIATVECPRRQRIYRRTLHASSPFTTSTTSTTTRPTATHQPTQILPAQPTRQN